MKPKRLIALLAGGLFLLLLGFAWTRGQNEFSDADQALANVGKLKPGITMQQMIETLHPERSANVSQRSYSYRPGADGVPEMIHAVTPSRYLVMKYSAPKPGSSGDPLLKKWEVREGSAPREDVIIGRALTAGNFRFYY